MEFQILNGPNLNKVGSREKDIYGDIRMDDYMKLLREHFQDMTLDYYQSNIEGEIIDALQEAAGKYDGLVVNAGGYTHTSVSIRDAIGSLSLPVVEVHISNLSRRESFRHTSLITPVCDGSVMGFGLDGYRLAIEGLRLMIAQRSKPYK
jgi:3-dehydroquinate dehydratase-2